MKITPTASLSNSITGPGQTGASAVDRVRTISMNTNATPGYSPEAPSHPELSIVPNSEQTAPAVEATEPLSPQFARIAKEKRALQAMRRELETKMKALTDGSQGRDSIDIARIKSEPLRVLLENGVTYDQLTEAILANQSESSQRDPKYYEELIEKRFAAQEAAQKKQVLAEMQREASDMVAQSDDFELVRNRRALPTVMDLIDRTHAQTGEILDVSEALQLVEDELTNEYQGLVKLKKFQSQTNPETLTPPQSMPRASGMRTLTNKDTASTSLSVKQRAIAAMNGTLRR